MYLASVERPKERVFLQRDPIGFWGGPNLYGYVLQDPINNIDPSGLAGKPPWNTGGPSGGAAGRPGEDPWEDFAPRQPDKYGNPSGGGGGKSCPGTNQAQNKQFNDVVNELGLNKDQQRRLHDDISGQGLSYQEILEWAKTLFGK